MSGKALRIDLFSPALLFPAAFVFYFGFGSLNLIDWGEIPLVNWLYYLLALASYFMGIAIPSVAWNRAGRKGSVAAPPTVAWRSSFPLIIALLSLVSFAAMALSWRKTGIPILSSEVDITRVEASSNGYLTVIFLTIKSYFVLLYLYLRTSAKRISAGVRWFVSGNMLLIFLALLATANRGHVVTVFLTCIFVYIYTMREPLTGKRLVRVCLFGGGLLMLFSVIGYLRYLTMFDGGFLKDIVSVYNYPPALLLLAPLYLYIRNGPKMFNDVLEAMQHHDYTYGKLHLAPVVAPFQAKLESADMVIKKMLGMEFEGFGVAASLLSSFYIEFGGVGIFIGMLLAGLTIQHLYRKMLYDRQPSDIGVFAFFMMNLMMALYGNIMSSFNVIWTPLVIYAGCKIFVVAAVADE